MGHRTNRCLIENAFAAALADKAAVARGFPVP
jgi:hypothetical protein